MACQISMMIDDMRVPTTWFLSEEVFTLLKFVWPAARVHACIIDSTIDTWFTYSFTIRTSRAFEIFQIVIVLLCMVLKLFYNKRFLLCS